MLELANFLVPDEQDLLPIRFNFSLGLSTFLLILSSLNVSYLLVLGDLTFEVNSVLLDHSALLKIELPLLLLETLLSLKIPDRHFTFLSSIHGYFRLLVLELSPSRLF